MKKKIITFLVIAMIFMPAVTTKAASGVGTAGQDSDKSGPLPGNSSDTIIDYYEDENGQGWLYDPGENRYVPCVDKTEEVRKLSEENGRDQDMERPRTGPGPAPAPANDSKKLLVCGMLCKGLLESILKI